MLICSACGKENPEGFSFCGHCAARLTEHPKPREVRKTLTVLFCDVVGSTSLGERLDPESMRRVMSRYFEEMRTILEGHGATVEKFVGDAIMAVFGIPRLHEDDALRAARAAVEMREALATLNKELERDWGVAIDAHTGINTGEVVVGGGGGTTLATGDAVNVAARLEQAAAPGEILLGEITCRLIRRAVEVERVEHLSLKGRAAPIEAFRLIHVTPALAAVGRRFETPFVGREGELRLVRDAFDRAVRDRACFLLTVLGAAGIGKSRLIEESVTGLDHEVRVLRGRCLPYGEGITYWPVVEFVTQAAGLNAADPPPEIRRKLLAQLEGDASADQIAERLEHLLGVPGAAGSPHETFWAVRKLLEALARRCPLVVVLDDLGWGAPSFLDLVENIADLSRDAPMLLACAARSELLDERPAWAGGKMNTTSFLLEPLSDHECGQLVSNLLDGTDPPEEARRLITSVAEGNPLFVEQMVAMMIDDGVVARHGGRWMIFGDLGAVTVPPSMHALLGARLDRLCPEERGMIERASIEGKVFHRRGLVALSPDELRQEIDTHLTALVRRELIRPDTSSFPGDEAFRFRNLLIRDAAYGSIPKAARAELHERFADWLTEAAGDRSVEFAEIVGHHLEQAFRLRSELGPVDDRARALAERAADHLAASGMRARERGDAGAAAGLLSRAVALYPAEDPNRLELLPDLAYALLGVGSYERAEAVAGEARSLAESTGDRGLGARAIVARELVRADTATPSVEDSMNEVKRQITVLESLGEARGLAEAWTFVGMAYLWLGRMEPSKEALERAVAHAEAAAEPWRAIDALAELAYIGITSSAPASEAVRETEAVLERAGGYRFVVAEGSSALAWFAAMRGNIEEARRLDAVAHGIHEELGMTAHDAAHAMMRGRNELLVGDPAAAELELRPGYETLQHMGEKGHLATVAGYLAEAVARQGRDQEAEEIAGVAREASGEDDFGGQILWRIALAEVRRHEGGLHQAETLAREAVRIADGTDVIDDRSDSRMALAEVLREAGRAREADAVGREALALYEHRENLVMAERTRAFLRRSRIGEA